MNRIPLVSNLPDALSDLYQELDRLRQKVWHTGLSTAPLDGQEWAPTIDVAEDDAAYYIRAEIPGLSAEDVEVSILDSTLTLTGVKPPADLPAAAKNKLHHECRYGRFCRRYVLPGPVLADTVSATCKKGVLIVTVPKVSVEQGRKVEVQSQD